MKKKFSNRYLSSEKRSLVDFFRWRLGSYSDSDRKSSPPEGFTFPESKEEKKTDTLVQWIGHCTFLLQMRGITFLTDPIFGEYCSPLALKMFKRKVPPFLSLEQLPPIHCILISHNHYDHLDACSVAFIARNHPETLWVVPQGVKAWFTKRGIKNVEELCWWQTTSIGNVEITAVPAQHFSGRGLFDRNKTHWCGFVLEQYAKKIYFSGDTGYNPVEFCQIGKKFTSINLSLLPIGTYIPREFMKPVHCSPEEAVQIHLDVGSKKSVGMHWQTFKLSEEPLDRPPYDLYRALEREGLSCDVFLPGVPGRIIYC